MFFDLSMKSPSELMSNLSESRAKLGAPIFNGANYEFWSIRMKTIFKSHNFWSFVENGYQLPLDDKQMDKKQQIIARDLISEMQELWG